ncbi:MAG: NUDIX domain-containing protein [Akkermansia muciniphila]|nr:NUDIX domain-containing protein [Akkermansia muciniphila]
MSHENIELWRNNAAAVIMDDAANVLLGCNGGKSPYLHVPQGGVRSKETLLQAALREVQEETGLPADALHLIAELGGLRYRYRSKNRKSSTWDGQQQTYFLLRLPGMRPALPPLPQDSELSALRWVPAAELREELFVPFKRPAVRVALRAFFPIPGPVNQLLPLLRDTLTVRRYANAPQTAPDDTALFGGGKEEVIYQMEDLAKRLDAAQEGKSLLLVLMGSEGSGRKNTLRAVARCLDPLCTRAFAPRPLRGAEEELAAATPPPETALLLGSSPYEIPEALPLLPDWEAELARRGTRVVKLLLRTSYEAECKRREHPISPGEYAALRARQDAVMAATPGPFPWYVVPADRRWYRNYIAARVVAESLEGPVVASRG